MSALELQTVQCRITDGVGVLTLDRPAQLNAWIPRLGDDLLAALDACAADSAVRAIVITGAGRAFSSGADLKNSDSINPDGTIDVLTPLRESYNPVMTGIRTIPKPVIAAVNGPAAGIGCSLALACDLVVAARSAYFLLAFVNIGLGLDGGASLSLTARVGFARAFEMAYLGERIGAEQALEWGMVNRVVDDEELPGAVDELAHQLAAGAAGSYAAIKRTINSRAYDGFAELLELEAVLQQERVESADFHEALIAFAQKRAPVFSRDSANGEGRA